MRKIRTAKKRHNERKLPQKNIDMSIGDRIKTIRENERLSQEKFAKELQISKRALINWEKTKQNQPLTYS
ncbi:MAG: helix-turn-helix transcriptional regulator [Sphingomonadales bacterium]|nr:helix-turn-helix transcriptional regulator [Sphingomonadales bacterium]